MVLLLTVSTRMTRRSIIPSRSPVHGFCTREIDGESPARRFLWRLLFGERDVPGKEAIASQAEHAGHEFWYAHGVHC